MHPEIDLPEPPRLWMGMQRAHSSGGGLVRTRYRPGRIRLRRGGVQGRVHRPQQLGIVLVLLER
ncbi:hypothetical protein AB0J52_03680 [Spirillospora sp. NPDC049652]